MLYLLKFDRPLGSGKHGKAQFYLGYCEDGRLKDRLTEHRNGRGAAITRACVAKGIDFTVAAVLPTGTRDDERRYKRWKNHRHVMRRWQNLHI